jgi:hypothetical protein
MEVLTDYATVSSRRKRHIHEPTKLGVVNNLGSGNQPNLKRAFTATLNPSNVKLSKTISTGPSKINKLHSANMKWEEFDRLATGITDEEVASTTTGLSIASGYKLKVPQMMPSSGGLLEKRSKSNKNFNTGRDLNYKTPGKQNKPRDYQPYEYFDNYEQVPVSVVYEELESEQNVSQYVASQLLKPKTFKASEKPKIRVDENRPSNEKPKFKAVEAPCDISDEFLIKMEQSLNHDVMKATAKKQPRSSIPKRMMDGDNDDTLNLSPIQKTNNSFSERSFHEEQRRESYAHRDYEKESLATPTISPLYKPQSTYTRKPKYINVELAKTQSVYEEPRKNMTKPVVKRYTSNEIRSSAPVITEGFRDLMHYENFQNDLKSVPERHEEEEDSRNSSDNYHSSYRYQSNAVKSQKFKVPEEQYGAKWNDEPVDTPKSTVSIRSNALSNITSSTGGRSKIRRYGKNKHEREMALR